MEKSTHYKEQKQKFYKLKQIKFNKKRWAIWSGLIALVFGGVGAFVSVGLKIGYFTSAQTYQTPQPKKLKTLLKIAGLATRAGIQSTENNLSPSYVMKYYGNQTYKLISGTKTTVSDLWSNYFHKTTYDLTKGAKTGHDLRISYGGVRTPYKNSLVDSINTTILPIIGILRGGFTAGKAAILKSLIKYKLSGAKIDVNSPFMTRLFGNAMTSAFDISWAYDKDKQDYLTYDQIWNRKVPLIICNFLTKIINWQRVFPAYGWLVPINFNLTDDNYNDRDSLISTRIYHLTRIMIDDLVFNKGHYLLSWSEIIYHPAALKSIIRLLLFVGSYISHFLNYSPGYQPQSDDKHLFAPDKDNNQLHKIIGNKPYCLTELNLDEWGQLINALLVVQNKQPKDYMNKLKLWNILFDNQVEFKKTPPKKAYHDKIGTVKVIGISKPVEINWAGIDSQLPKLKVDGQLHGLDCVWHAFTTPTLTQILISSANLQRHYVKKIPLGRVELPDTWKTVQNILDYLNVETIVPQFLNWFSQNSQADISSNVFENYLSLINDFLNLVKGKNIKLASLQLALDQLIPSIQKYEGKLVEVGDKVTNLKDKLHNWHKSTDLGAFQSLYQGGVNDPTKPNILTIFLQAFNPKAKSSNLETWLTQPLDLINNDVFYYWRGKSVSQIGQYLSQLLHPINIQPVASIKLDYIKQLISSLVGEPETWAKQHPDVYDFSAEKLDLKSQTMLQYALRLLQYQGHPSTGQKVGVEATFCVFGLDEKKQELAVDSIFQHLSDLYQGDGINRILNSGAVVLNNIKDGMRLNEQNNYAPLLTDNHYSLEYSQKLERDAQHQVWLVDFVVSYYRTPMVLTSRYFYQLKIGLRAPVVFWISMKL